MFSKSVWYLPAALFVSFILYGLIGLWYSEWVAVGYERESQGGIYGILKPGTVDAIQTDERLHDALLSLTAMVASKSEMLGEQVGSDSLKEFGQSLTIEMAKLKQVRPQRKKRGLLEDLGNMITGSSKVQSHGGDALASLGDALGLGDGNSTGGLGSLLQQGLSSIGDSIVGGLATPALFLGIGIGMGTDTGLNLTDTQNSQAIASKVAVAFNAQPTGINQVAQNLGTGLSAQLAPSLGNLSTGAQLGMAAFALAQGIGQGSATGLKLTQQQVQPSNGTDIMSIAGNFGLGVSQPIASTINIQQLFSGASGSMAQLPQIAVAAGRGFGEGASAGLGLSKNTTSLQKRQSGDPNAVDLPGTIGDFSRGLSQSFLQTSDLSKIAPGASGLGNIDIMGMLIPIASGAGKGIGEGAAIGFGFQADAGLAVMPANASSNQSTELVVSEFAKGLVASFLANGTATIALGSLTAGAGGLTSGVQAPKVAEGLARGLVEGSINAISMVGGINNLVSGNFSATAAINIPEMAPSAFNDSVNGSAIAFGRGLAGEGTLLIANLITNMTKKAPQKRSIAAIESGVVTSKALIKRQDAPSSSPALAISSTMLSSLAQAGTNALTCQGFGGLAAIALGLKNSGAVKLDSKSSVPLDNQTLAALPKDPITITSEGNRFTIKTQNGEIRINDLALVPFAVLTALHVLFTTFAFFYALPTYLALGAVLRLSVMIGYPLDEEKIKKWRRLVLLVAFLPSALFGTIFGIVGIGKAGHFRDAHGIVGLLTFLLIIPTVVTTVLRLRSKAIVPPAAFAGIKAIPPTFNSPARIHLIAALFQQVILQLATLTWIQGFSTLRSISLCIVDAILTAPVVVGLMTAILFTQVGAMSIVGLRMWLEQRIVKKSDLPQGEGGSVEKGAMNRSDTIKTFGFNERELPTLPSISPTPPSIRPELKERNTRELLGREDSKIGWPSQVRKFGDDEAIDPRRNDENPFLAPGEQSQDRVYDEKLGGFVLSPTRQSQYAAYRPGQQQPSPTRPSYESQSTYPDFAYERDRPGRQSAPRNSLAAGMQRKPVSGAEEERGDSAVLPQRYESFSRLRKERASGPDEEEIRVGWPSFVANRDGQR